MFVYGHGLYEDEVVGGVIPASSADRLPREYVQVLERLLAFGTTHPRSVCDIITKVFACSHPRYDEARVCGGSQFAGARRARDRYLYTRARQVPGRVPATHPVAHGGEKARKCTRIARGVLPTPELDTSTEGMNSPAQRRFLPTGLNEISVTVHQNESRSRGSARHRSLLSYQPPARWDLLPLP